MILLIIFLTIILLALFVSTIRWFVLLSKNKKGLLIFRSPHCGGLVDSTVAQDQLINIKSHARTVYFVLFSSGLLFLLPWIVLFYKNQESKFLVVSVGCFVAIILVAYLMSVISKDLKVKD